MYSLLLIQTQFITFTTNLHSSALKSDSSSTFLRSERHCSNAPFCFCTRDGHFYRIIWTTLGLTEELYFSLFKNLAPSNILAFFY